MIRALLASLVAPSVPADPYGIEAGIAARRQARLAKPPRQSLRFERARGKVEQLRLESGDWEIF